MKYRAYVRAFLFVRAFELYEKCMPQVFFTSDSISKNSPAFKRYLFLLRRYMKTADSLQISDEETLQFFQEMRLRKIVAVAGKTSWWKEYFATKHFLPGSSLELETFQTLPPISRPMLTEIPKEEFLTRHAGDPTIIWRRSGGSTTGTPLVWGLNKTLLILSIAASMLSQLERRGFHFKENAYQNFCMHLNMFIGADMHSFKWFARKDFFIRIYDPDFEEKIRTIDEMLKRSKDMVIITSPNELAVLVDGFKKYGFRPHVPFFMTVGSILTSETRALAEDFFSAQVISWYGSQEIGPSAIECPDNVNYFHVLIDRVIIEILNEEGLPVQEGLSGEITVTCLDNTVMPLLRYQLGDVGVLHTDSPCTCGATSPLLEILQRNTDVIKFSDGTQTSAAGLLKYFRRDPFIKLVRRFQIRQGKLDSITIVLEVRETIQPKDIADLERAVRVMYRKSMEVTIEQTSAIVQEAKKFKVFVPLP